MVTNVTSLLKTVKTVEDEAARGTQALESAIEAIGQEMRVMHIKWHLHTHCFNCQFFTVSWLIALSTYIVRLFPVCVNQDCLCHFRPSLVTWFFFLIMLLPLLGHSRAVAFLCLLFVSLWYCFHDTYVSGAFFNRFAAVVLGLKACRWRSKHDQVRW